jgi:MFS family permease
MAMEGLGSACNTPTAIGLFSAHFPPGPKRNIAYGALGAGQAVGFIIGLVLGAPYVSIGAGYMFTECFRWNIDGKLRYMASNLLLPSRFRLFLRYPGMDGPRERADSATLYQGHRLGRCCSKYGRFRAYDLQSRVRIFMSNSHISICESI